MISIVFVCILTYKIGVQGAFLSVAKYKDSEIKSIERKMKKQENKVGINIEDKWLTEIQIHFIPRAPPVARCSH